MVCVILEMQLEQNVKVAECSLWKSGRGVARDVLMPDLCAPFIVWGLF